MEGFSTTPMMDDWAQSVVTHSFFLPDPSIPLPPTAMIEILLESTQPAVLLAVAGVFLVVFLAVSSCVYNVFFHPLRKFPGPKIAAIGGYYEFFYDVLQDGMYAWEVEKMHQKYGEQFPLVFCLSLSSCLVFPRLLDSS